MHKRSQLVPLGFCAAVAGLICFLTILSRHSMAIPLFRELEWIVYDWRVRQAVARPSLCASNLGFVYVQDESITALLSGELGYRVGLYWPRHVYGRLTRELQAQGAKAVGFDVLFQDLRPDHDEVQLDDGSSISSDQFFAQALADSGNVILAAAKATIPPNLFRTNAWALGDIATQPDSDGVLRRSRAFNDYHLWHPLIRQAAQQEGFDLQTARFEPTRIVFPQGDGDARIIPLENGLFNQVALYEVLTGGPAPPRIKAWQQPATPLRVWDLGIVLASRELGLDLSQARLEPAQRRIVFPGPNGLERVLPVDQEYRFLIDWSIVPSDRRLTREAIEVLLARERARRTGQTDQLTNRWAGKLVLVGSTASGNDLTDLGATPLQEQTYLTSRYWNVANSILLGRFIRPPSLLVEIALVIALCALAAALTWMLRSSAAFVGVVFLSTVYLFLTVHLYVQQRLWWPVVLPVCGILLTHLSLVTYRAFFEQKERRRIKGVFDRIVSPNVVHELLSTEHLSLGGARRNVTIFFADIRGFTQFTDDSHAHAEQTVQQRQLKNKEAEDYYSAQSTRLLNTVNTYLSLIADIVKKNEGTLDKYIGDCVMAFWGAPTPNPRHALAGVRCAIEVQQAIHALNQERALENQRREKENQTRTPTGQPPHPMLELMSLGVGINTGDVFVGLMGSHSHILNYTVFGRDVNLAQRLESSCASNRIVIGPATYEQILRQDPALAAGCLELPAASFKGFRTAISLYEVAWQPGSTDQPATGS